ncbi:MAG TPA: RNA polymerase sigma factor [Cytophagales bacterium]|nr:RNA polymerase sigma factor [Cytophagales bacterium]
MSNIEELFIQCQKQHLRAQEMLYKSLSGKMFVLCFRYLKNKEDAEDVLTEGFVKVFKHIPSLQYQGEAALIAWIKKIMVNEALGALRRRKTIVFEAHSEEIAIDAQPLASLGASDIYHMITELPLGLRTIFNLYAIEGYTHVEIAEMLGIAESTSRTQLMKARRALQEQLHKSQHYGS